MEREIEIKSKESVATPKPKDEPKKTLPQPAAADLRKLVSEDELYQSKFYIRAKLLLNDLPAAAYFDTLFDGYQLSKDTISVKEFTKLLGRKPVEVENSQAEQLARYLIEPRASSQVEFSQYRDRNLVEVKPAFEDFLGISYTFTKGSLARLVSGTLAKVKQKIPDIIKNLEAEKVSLSAINVKKWRAILQDTIPELDPIEKDVLIGLGLGSNGNKDMSKLSIQVRFCDFFPFRRCINEPPK